MVALCLQIDRQRGNDIFFIVTDQNVIHLFVLLAFTCLYDTGNALKKQCGKILRFHEDGARLTNAEGICKIGVSFLRKEHVL